MKSACLFAAAFALCGGAVAAGGESRGPFRGQPKPVGVKPAGAGGAAGASPDDDLCSIIYDDLPSFCSCTPNDIGGKVECSISIFDDTVNFIANIQPCAQPADIEFEISDTDLGVDYTKTISMQDSEQFDIPGLTFGIPGYASASAVADVTVGGDLDDVEISLGLDACASVAGFQVCGSSLTDELPVTVLEGTYDFSNICN